MARPKLVVTRRWPQEVEERLQALFDVQLNRSDTPLTVAELQEALRTADALLPTVSDRISAEVLSADPFEGPDPRQLRSRLQPHRHRCRQGARARRHQHPGGPDRLHGRSRHDAALHGGAPGGGGRTAPARARLDRLAPDLHDRHQDRRKDARAHRLRADRARRRGSGPPRVRDEDPLSGPLPAAEGSGRCGGGAAVRDDRGGPGGIRLRVPALPGRQGEPGIS